MDERLHNRHLEAQVGVLGSVLLDARWAGEVVHQTRPEDYSGAYRSIFEAVRQLFRDNKPIDPVTVRCLIGAEYTDLLLSLMDLTPTAVNCGEYIRLMLEQSRLLRIKDLAEQVLQSPVLADCTQLLSQANQIVADRQQTAVVSMSDGFLDFLESQQSPPDHVDWGFAALDAILHVGQGNLVVMGGYPSAGKTAFSLQLAWQQGFEKKIGYFSFETDPKRLVERQMSTVCGLDFEHVKQHRLSETEWAQCADQKAAFEGNRLELIHAAGMSMVEIQALTVGRGYDLIYIDYLQLICPEDRRRSEFEQVSQISRDLKTMANKTGVTICALSQLSRPKADGKQERAPGLHSLRQSGQIEQDADAVLLLYKEEPNRLKSRRCLKVAKNKEGPAGLLIMLDFDGRRQRFAQSTIQQSAQEAIPRSVDEQMTLSLLPDRTPVPF